MTIWHNNTIAAFSKEIYSKDLLFDDLVEEIEFNEEDFWIAKFGKFKLLLLSDNIKDLPIKLFNPLDNPAYFERVNISNKVFYKITLIKKVKIGGKKTMESWDWFKAFSDISHSNPFHYSLYKGINLAGMFSKINTRVASESEFGKNAITKSLKLLTNHARIITPASFPALLRGILTTDLLNITEPKQFEHFDTFLEIAGDRDTSFENPKLESKGYGTHNQYDIQNLSVLLTYNTLNYYKERTQESIFFDNLFRHHIQIRYLPFMFEGQIKEVRSQKLDGEAYKQLLDWLRNYYYFKEEYSHYSCRFPFSVEKMKWGIRYKETFAEIAKFFDFVSKDEKEFEKYIDGLVKCHIAYERMINKNNMGIYDVIEPKKAEHIREESLKVEEEEVLDSSQIVSPLFAGSPPQTLKYLDFKKGVLEMFDEKEQISIADIFEKYYKSMNELVIEQAIQKLKDEKEIFEPRSGFIRRLE